MVHNHDEHEKMSAMGSRAIKINLIIAGSIMVVEIIGGLLSNSLALLGDAGHMLVDCLALGLTLFALTIARRPATITKTYGFHRVEIMVALANGITLVVLALAIFYEAYQRFLKPPEVRTTLMLIVAAIGFIANYAGIVIIRRTGKMSLNIKAAFWHIVGDTIASLGVIAAGLVIITTGWSYADPLIAVIIGGIILWGAVLLVKESVDILLEAVPKQIEVGEVVKTLAEISGIEEIHDIHIWTITSGIYAMSAHLVIKDQMVSRSTEIMEAVNRMLAAKFNITHTTLQPECDNCPTNNVCAINPNEHKEG